MTHHRESVPLERAPYLNRVHQPGCGPRGLERQIDETEARRRDPFDHDYFGAEPPVRLCGMRDNCVKGLAVRAEGD